jgi:hypothetical protein
LLTLHWFFEPALILPVIPHMVQVLRCVTWCERSKLFKSRYLAHASMPSTSLFSDAIAAISLRLHRSRDTSSLKSKQSRRSSHRPYSVYQQTMFPAILRDPDAAKKLFETIIDSPNGRRSMSRLARTCRAMCEPALNVLWRELDSLLPLISLFPNNLMKRSRRPGLGLVGLH